MDISKHSFASNRYRFTSRQVEKYPGDEIPTRSVCMPCHELPVNTGPLAGIGCEN